ncbi:MAG: m5C1962 methyltransferase RlmI [Myxococcaceae bacterium]|nr:m5C1962 methyltransferase RlmI [Myxococcaceae bacterium]
MSPPTVEVRLRKPVERAIAGGHPWIYRDALLPFEAPAGAIATVRDGAGRFVARGLVDGDAIGVRLFTTRDESLSRELVALRFARAIELRRAVVPADTDAWRLLHGEGDRLPGFTCDRYGDAAVLGLDGPGAEARWELVRDGMREGLAALGVRTLLVRRRGHDGAKVEVVEGELGDAVRSVRERGMVLRADLLHGQKTGLFLDQRESRHRVRGIASGLRVLNLYSYTGGFSVAAGLGGAKSVTSVDVAPGAIALAQETWAANGLATGAHEAVVADVPAWLQQVTKERRRFDLVIADPPSFAPNDASVPTALKSYRTLHAACLALVAPGGWYLAGSCSSHVTREMFVDSLEETAGRASKVLQVIDAWGAPGDHPRLLAFPEGDYLKNVLMRVTD